MNYHDLCQQVRKMKKFLRCKFDKKNVKNIKQHDMKPSLVMELYICPTCI